MKKLLGLLLASLVLVLAGCGADDAVKDGVRKVKVAYEQATKPMTYTDDDGNATGYDVEVLREVAKKLPQYEFEFVGTSDDDLIIGVEQGKYQVGVKNAFYTEERAKKFIYPKEFIGLSSTGFVLKKENEAIESLADFATAGLSLAPIAANNAQYSVVERYNEGNPDNPVALEAGEIFSLDVIQWVLEGRVDGAVTIEGIFNNQVLDEAGPYYEQREEIVYREFAVIETWPLFNKDEQEFADAFDKAIKEVKEPGITNKLSEEFYGKDLFQLLD